MLKFQSPVSLTGSVTKEMRLALNLLIYNLKHARLILYHPVDSGTQRIRYIIVIKLFTAIILYNLLFVFRI